MFPVKTTRRKRSKSKNLQSKSRTPPKNRFSGMYPSRLMSAVHSTSIKLLRYRYDKNIEKKLFYLNPDFFSFFFNFGIISTYMYLAYNALSQHYLSEFSFENLVSCVWLDFFPLSPFRHFFQHYGQQIICAVQLDFIATKPTFLQKSLT